MEQTFYDCSTDGGSESGDTSVGGSEGRGEGGGREADSGGESMLPDSSQGGADRHRRKKRSQHHQVSRSTGVVGSPGISCTIYIAYIMQQAVSQESSLKTFSTTRHCNFDRSCASSTKTTSYSGIDLSCSKAFF